MPQFDSMNSKQSIVKWIKAAELVYHLCRLKKNVCFLFIWQTEPSLCISSKRKRVILKKKKKKDTLYTVFATDSFMADHLCSGESVDVYIAELQKLSIPFGDMIIVARLLDYIKQVFLGWMTWP